MILILRWRTPTLPGENSSQHVQPSLQLFKYQEKTTDPHPTVFRNRLKTYLFSYILTVFGFQFCTLCVEVVQSRAIGHLNNSNVMYWLLLHPIKTFWRCTKEALRLTKHKPTTIASAAVGMVVTTKRSTFRGLLAAQNSKAKLCQSYGKIFPLCPYVWL